MIFNETFDYLWSQLAQGQDLQATRRMKEYQRKRLKRAQLALALRAFFLEASWSVAAGLIGETHVASTSPVTQPLLVLDGAIRSTDSDVNPPIPGSNNNFEIQLIRTGGDSRVQPSTSFIKDEHLFSPAQAAIRAIDVLLGQGAPWPLTWPVPIYLAPNELLQLTSKILTGGVAPAEAVTFVQFRALNVNGKDEDDSKVAELRDWINANDLQRPKYLSMATEGFHSIVFPNALGIARTTAKTMETNEPLLVVGYSMLLDRLTSSGGAGFDPSLPLSSPKWRLTSSDGWEFSKEEIDCSTFAYAGPSFRYREMPFPFLLPKGSSLSASFSRLADSQSEEENKDNYVIFRCVTV